MNIVDWNNIESSLREHLGDRDAWIQIAVRALTEMKTDTDRQNENYPDSTQDDYPEIVQIKEKMGSLRIYVRNDQWYYTEPLDDAERTSETTCELCGNLALRQSIRGFVVTRCPFCIHKKLADRGMPDLVMNQNVDLESDDINSNLICKRCGYLGAIAKHDDKQLCTYCTITELSNSTNS